MFTLIGAVFSASGFSYIKFCNHFKCWLLAPCDRCRNLNRLPENRTAHCLNLRHYCITVNGNSGSFLYCWNGPDLHLLALSFLFHQCVFHSVIISLSLSACCLCFKTWDCERLQLSFKYSPLLFSPQWDGNINQLGWPLKDRSEADEAPLSLKMKCHRLLNPVKGHFFPILLLRSFVFGLTPSTSALFHSPLPVSFIFAPIPRSFLMCNTSGRSANERTMKSRVYSRVQWEDEMMMKGLWKHESKQKKYIMWIL